MIALITSILSVFGAGLGSLLSWAVSYFQQKANAEKQADQQMNSDLSEHAGDGALSVAIKDSVDAQDQDLNIQAAALDAAAAAAPTQPKGMP